MSSPINIYIFKPRPQIDEIREPTIGVSERQIRG